jgi:hypothetical protein
LPSTYTRNTAFSHIVFINIIGNIRKSDWSCPFESGYKLGYEVQIATDGAKAIVKLLDSSVKLIVSSGYSEAPVASDLRKYGFDDIIPKPWTIASLSEVFRRVLVPFGIKIFGHQRNGCHMWRCLRLKTERGSIVNSFEAAQKG